MADLDQILENEEIRGYFQRAVESDRISHCYVIGGEDGLGKMTLAKAVAQTLVCESAGKRPCGKCSACIRFESGNFPDIIYPVHTKPSVFGVDDVRDGIVKDILVRPVSSRFKIYIVDEAEKMSVQAQNALLKTIEEPPAYGILFLLTTNPDGLLETIRSRSIVLGMNPVSDGTLRAYLSGHGIEEEKLSSLVRFSQGNIGKAMKLAGSEDFIALTEKIMILLRNADTLSFDEMMNLIGYLEECRLDVRDILSFVRMWFRDVLMLKATGNPNLIIFAEEYSSIRRFSQNYSYNGLNHIIEEIDVTEHRLDANVNFVLCMELLWITIRDAARE